LEDTSPKLIVCAQIMPDPYNNAFVNTDTYANEISYFGEAVYHTTLENTGVMTDTITVEFAHEILPDGLGPFDWAGFYCDSNGICHFGPWDYVLAPGEAETFDVHVVDGVGNTKGMALSTLSAISKADPLAVSTESFATFVELPSILLVDDDNGGAFESHLKSAVEDTGYAVRVLDADADGRPSLAQLTSYWAVLWTTANGDATYLDADDEQNLATYLDGGGNLMLSSMEFLSSRVETSAFVSDYLHIDTWVNNNGGFIMTGVGGDDISDGMSLTIIGGPFPVNDSDAINAVSPAEAIFTSPPGTKGIKVADNDYKVVFLSFPFEDVKTATADPSNQKTLIGRVLKWFEKPTGVADETIHRLALRQNFPNPFNPVTTLAFSVPEAAGPVTLTVHNIAGQVVRTLVDGELPVGPAMVVWDGTSDDGSQLSSGVYFAKLAAGQETAFRKMTLLK
ncbi:MAG: T9SS type A sorting domain-containing protein, partial [Candidatus Eisenbacteria bacterium]|nr:T9SS type A sorting domain-containing protein [Candidatus Eisenbacteria bacterium]